MQRVLVPHAPPSAGVVRRQVVSELRDRGVDESVIDDAAVVVSELVGNAIRHGRPRHDGCLAAAWSVGPRMLHVEVQDGGQGPRGPLPGPTPDQLGGRGLLLVEAMSLSWGVRPAGDGCSVWVDVPLAGTELALRVG